jgi:uncharacterized membrane protein YkoI
MRYWWIIALFAVGADPALAHDEDHDLARALRTQGTIVSLEKIADTAAKLQPGDLLEVELKRRGDEYLYEVEVLDPEGRTWELMFDARTGELLKKKEDD